MQYVEITMRKPLFDLAVGRRTEPQPGHRAVVGNRNRPTTGDKVIRQCGMRGGRREHTDQVAAGAHHLGKL
ncbi:Uncharacterised protein [Mycobacterium tuberculosis]|uniref:Uncharacterized protein n=1 Tax=Mycobacterium tuberculosis TaxID=1773 RepID=A0A0U0RS57_MYCTX|nr:Uncharacterised protein [Mycobacterium tuberculosis]COW23814.1 Uncharacterised protein [Mycobacterium tuberculosis]